MVNKNTESSNRRYLRNAVIGILLISGVTAGLWYAEHSPNSPKFGDASKRQNDTAMPPSPELQIYKPLLPEEAKEENEKLPFSNAPIERALPLVLPSQDLQLIGRRNAADCLTSAIYYEAGYELNQGKRAVAQVVLNRVRHPAYPKTICGVIYQGAERKTGCQFTFTCDGSLVRRPSRERWEQARLIALGAISGVVEPSVGMATHYHANYVLPYWAPSLDKVAQIGTHIFYKWKGSWGRRRAFSQAVQLDTESGTIANGIEILLVAEDVSSVTSEPDKVTSRIIADEQSPTDALIAQSSDIKPPVISELQADQKRPRLLIDEKPIVKD